MGHVAHKSVGGGPSRNRQRASQPPREPWQKDRRPYVLHDAWRDTHPRKERSDREEQPARDDK